MISLRLGAITRTNRASVESTASSSKDLRDRSHVKPCRGESLHPKYSFQKCVTEISALNCEPLHLHFSRFSGIETAKEVYFPNVNIKDHILWCCMMYGTQHFGPKFWDTKQVWSLFLEADFWMLASAYARISIVRLVIRNRCDLAKRYIKNSVVGLITPVVYVVAPCLPSSTFIEMYDEDSMTVYTIHT